MYAYKYTVSCNTFEGTPGLECATRSVDVLFYFLSVSILDMLSLCIPKMCLIIQNPVASFFKVVQVPTPLILFILSSLILFHICPKCQQSYRQDVY